MQTACLNVHQTKKLSLSSGRGCGSTLEELANDAASEGQLVPAIVRACVEYIEQEGLTAEGLYRVPGNRTHVDQLIESLRQGTDLHLSVHCVGDKVVTIDPLHILAECRKSRLN